MSTDHSERLSTSSSNVEHGAKRSAPDQELHSDELPEHGHGGHGHGGHGHGGHGHGGHGHGGHGGHGHAALPSASGTRTAFAVSSVLNLAFVVVEFVYGALASSTALVADAAHNLGDVMGLLLAWGAVWLKEREPSKTRTYGLRKSTVLASLANALLLVLTVGAVMWEAAGRLGNPHPVDGQVVLWVAAVGVAINASSALLLMRGAHQDLNLRGAYLHMVADASVSLAVVIAGVIISTNPAWGWVDPVASFVVSAVVLVGAWKLLRQAVHLSLDGVPAHLDAEAVRATLRALPGVVEVADLHVWALSTSECALTAHLVVDELAPTHVAQTAGAKVREVYGIGHSTIQIEVGAPDPKCTHC